MKLLHGPATAPWLLDVPSRLRPLGSASVAHASVALCSVIGTVPMHYTEADPPTLIRRLEIADLDCPASDS
jgi:hypothetical protein